MTRNARAADTAEASAAIEDAGVGQQQRDAVVVARDRGACKCSMRDLLTHSFSAESDIRLTVILLNPLLSNNRIEVTLTKQTSTEIKVSVPAHRP